MEYKSDLKDCLSYIDPSELDYQEWVNVGMALKEEGYSPEDWDEWSMRDPQRYRRGECKRKWETFRGSGKPVTAGTVVAMARDRGWQPKRDGGREMDWNDTIGGGDTAKTGQNGVSQLITYLETLFEAGENVGYVTRSWERDGKFLPTKGCWDRTAGQLIEGLSKCGGDIGSVLGDCNENAGAWIRFNPLDGKGVKNDNVTDFRYALIESDTMALKEQEKVIRELELPVACLVYSGGKSLHAIVRVEAGSYEEYRKRVDYLYTVCQKNGMELDRQNRNPSRLSRMPGVMRKGERQTLIDTNIGKKSWQEWYDWIEGVNDDLPEPESIAEVWDNLPGLPSLLLTEYSERAIKCFLQVPLRRVNLTLLLSFAAPLPREKNGSASPAKKGVFSM